MLKKPRLLVYVLGAIALVLLISIGVSMCTSSNSKCECPVSFDSNGDNKCETCGGYVEHKHAPLNGRCVFCGKCVTHVDKNSNGKCDNCQTQVAVSRN